MSDATQPPADVREPTDAQINVWSIIRSALSRAWAVADRPQVTSEVVARLDAIAADCEREVLALLRTPRGEWEAMDADAMWYHWSSGHEAAALQGLRTATDDEAHRFLDMLARWQKCPKPSDHAARRGEGGE